MQKEPIKLIIYINQFHDSYRPHMNLFSITIIEFHFNPT